MNRESLEPSSRRWIGRVLRDKWRIDARISRGGVGTVYAATHKNNGSRAAIKVLHAEFSADADTRSRFLQEGYAANQVNHPGVVRILDDDVSEDGHAYLVMELLEGELLEGRRVRKGGTLPLPDVYEVGEQLLDVLASAHDKEIVHRDIKPDNLFITHEGRLKVLDFGFAQMRSNFRSEQTATGFLLGTPGFMSPEQAIGNRPEVDAQTDIWAVGATLFTLISGEPVHAGDSAAEMLVAAANYAPRSLATVTNGLNPRLVRVVDRAVAFAKADRWPNARIMQLALREVSGKQRGGQVSRRSIPDEMPLLYGDDVESIELDPSELKDASSWGSIAGEAETVMGPALVKEAELANENARLAAASPHPADQDGPTVAQASFMAGQGEFGPDSGGGPETVLRAPYSSGGVPSGPGMLDAQVDGGTLIMESPAALHDSFAQQPHPPYGANPSDPQIFHAADPRATGPHYAQGAGADAGYPSQSPASRSQRLPAQNGSRVLIFVGVAVCTMIVVIVAGLLMIGLSD